MNIHKLLLPLIILFLIPIAYSASPVTNSSRISPATSAYVNQTLVGYCNATDADSDPVAYGAEFYKNSVLYSQTTDNFFNTGDGSDGELIFTTTTKSFGNLTNGTDYNASGNTLNLMTNRVYQFTNFSLGSGTTLTTLNTTGAVIYILVQDTANISGTVQLSNKVSTGNNTWTFTGDNNSIDSAGVAGSGSGYGAGGAGGFTNAYSAVWGGSGGAGGSSAGSGGASQSCTALTSKTGNAGGTSSGGGGACSVYSGVSSTSGTGGNAYGSNGAGGSCSAGGGSYPIAGGAGGGGAGGTAGKAGIHFYVKSRIILFSGSIDTSGTAGGAGGDGGDGSHCGYSGSGVTTGGAGGAGGSGGNAGNIVFFYSSLTDSGTKTMGGGSGGAGGTGGASEHLNQVQYDTASSGATGTTGSNGTFTSNQEGLYTQATEQNVLNISSAITSAGENWFLSCIANDGLTNSSWLNSTNTTIYNYPSVLSITIQPDISQLTEKNCTYTYNSTYTKAESAQYFKWYINSNHNTSHINQTLGAGNFSNGDNITCSVAVFDGTINSTWLNSSIMTIGDNVTPTITQFSLSTTTAFTDQSVYVYVNCSDDNALATNFPKVSYIEPSTSEDNHTMTSVAGDQYSYLIPLSSGTFSSFKVFCRDGSNNEVQNTTNSLSLTVTVRPAGGAGGGGGATTTIIEEGNFSMTTYGSENNIYDIYTYPNSNVERYITIKNLASEQKSFTISCQGDCRFVEEIIPEEFILNPSAEKLVFVKLYIPINTTFDQYQFSIIATDNRGAKGNIGFTLTVDRFFGFITEIFGRKMLDPFYYLSDYSDSSYIPNIAIIIPIVGILLFINIKFLNRIIKKKESLRIFLEFGLTILFAIITILIVVLNSPIN